MDLSPTSPDLMNLKIGGPPDAECLWSGFDCVIGYLGETTGDPLQDVYLVGTVRGLEPGPGVRLA